MVKSVREQIEEIKEQICETWCKWLDEANKVTFHSIEEVDKAREVLRMRCNECPLNKL